jgi:uncharacterized RDD family membrane protein YckC
VSPPPPPISPGGAAGVTATSATASPPASAATDDDLQDLLDRLHDDLDLGEHTPAVAVGTPTTLPTDATRPSVAAEVVIEIGAGIAFEPTFASFGARFAGLIVDIGVLTVLCLPGLALFMVASGAMAIVLGAVLLFAGFCVATVLYARDVSRTGQSFGNRVTKTHVVDARNGHTIAAGEAGTRYVMRMLISMILFIGFLVALGNSQRRTFHDNIAGTVVVQRTRASWSIDDETEQ